MTFETPDPHELTGMFELAAGEPVAEVPPHVLATITAAGRRRRRVLRAAVATPVVLASTGLVVGGLTLAAASPHHVEHLTIRPAASSSSATQHAAGCDQAGAGHYLIAAEIPAGLGARDVAAPTNTVPIELSWPSATPGGANLDFRIACSGTSPAPTGQSTPVDINGVSGTIVHDGSSTTVAWSPSPGYEISYRSSGGAGVPFADSVLVAMARAVPTAS